MSLSRRLGRAFLRAVEALDGPFGHLVERRLGRLYARVVFRGCARLGGVTAMGHVRVTGGAGIRLGDRTFFLDGLWPTELICHPSGRLEVGEGNGFNYGVRIEARERVTVGNNCRFASGVRISDSAAGVVAPVVIEDDVWIAHGARIGPGVTIGRGSIVSAGSVVTTSIPADRVAIGNPARSMPRSLVASVRPRAS